MKRIAYKVGIKGAYGQGNFGDDALMYAATEIVRRELSPDSIVHVCHNAKYLNRIVPKAVTVPSVQELEGNLDLLVYGGGTQFFSFPLTNPWGPIGLARRLIRYQEYIKLMKRLIPGLGSRSPIRGEFKTAAIGIGLGPFEGNPRPLRRARSEFSAMDFVGTRDTESYELCRRWGCYPLKEGADLCFFPSLWQLGDLGSLNLGGVGKRISKIGIIPRDWPHTREGDSYSRSLCNVVDTLRERGISVDFVSFSPQYDHDWRRRLMVKSETPVCWNPEEDSIQDFLERLNGYDAIITARYHGAVFASLLGKPVICIEIEQKLALFAERLGAGACLWRYPFNANHCLEFLSMFEQKYDEVVFALGSSVSQQLTDVNQMVCSFVSAVSKSDRVQSRFPIPPKKGA